MPVRLRATEAAARRHANEERLAQLLQRFAELGIDPVLISASEPPELLTSFLSWTELRRVRRAAGA